MMKLLLLLFVALLLVRGSVVDARGGFGPSALMRQQQRRVIGDEQYQQPRPPRNKKTESIKPTFIKTESPRGGGVDHVVLYKLNVEQASRGQIIQLQRGANSLASIEGVESITAGDATDSGEGYNYYLRVRLSSTDALKSFQDHPLHKAVFKKHFDPLLLAPPLAVDCTAAVLAPSR